MNKGTIITFYSYKGGVGRTFTLANVAALLSLWGYKTLCIDWDLEAPGLHLYFKPWLKPEPEPGLIEMIQSYADGNNPNWRDFVTEVTVPGAPHPLLLMQAGSLDASYVQRMQALDWDELYAEHRLGNFLESMRESWKEQLDVILIDSRTGISDTGSICTVQLPDILMLLLTANEQSLYGSLDTLARIQDSRERFPLDREKLLIVPVVSRFERRVEYGLSEMWLARFAELFSPLYSDWVHKDVSAANLLNVLRVPYVARWSFGEELPAIIKDTRDADDIGYSLETIAALLAHNLSLTDMLIQNRDTYVLNAKNSITQQHMQANQLKKGLRIFISYSHKDKAYVKRLEEHLSSLKRQGDLEIWSDTMMTPGESWDTAMFQMLEEANIILLLLSPDYLASDYLYEREAMHALERQQAGQAIVIPIIVRPVYWQGTPLAQQQPANAVPIAQRRDQDSAWLDIVKQINQLISTLREETVP